MHTENPNVVYMLNISIPIFKSEEKETIITKLAASRSSLLRR